MLKDKRKTEEKQAKVEELESRLMKYLKPVLRELNEKMDRRLVKTLLGLVMAILQHRHRDNGLLLSELGGYLLGAESCCAGTKRIGKLGQKQVGKSHHALRLDQTTLSETPAMVHQPWLASLRSTGGCLPPEADFASKASPPEDIFTKRIGGTARPENKAGSGTPSGDPKVQPQGAIPFGGHRRPRLYRNIR